MQCSILTETTALDDNTIDRGNLLTWTVSLTKILLIETVSVIYLCIEQRLLTEPVSQDESSVSRDSPLSK